jgi:hypothetical protein
MTRGLLRTAAAGCAIAAAALAGLVPGALAAPLPAGQIAPGVRIDGVAVGGLTRAEARAAVIARRVAPRRAPLVATFRGRRIGVDPVALGYRAEVDPAVRAAYAVGRTTPRRRLDVPLRESVRLDRITAVVRATARRLDTQPREAALTFAGARPRVSPSRVGVQVAQEGAVRALRRAVLGRRVSVALPQRRLVPERTRIGSVVVISRDEFKLRVYRNKKRLRTFPVAVGQYAYPTPAGTFELVSKQRNPTWYPPDSAWAAGLGPVAPGAGNPLGTRWMGISAPGIGIHGTPSPSSIGTRASHGCIRMYIHDAEALYEMIDYGTPVRIV